MFSSRIVAVIAGVQSRDDEREHVEHVAHQDTTRPLFAMLPQHEYPLKVYGKCS